MNNGESVAFVSTRHGLPTQSTAPRNCVADSPSRSSSKSHRGGGHGDSKSATIGKTSQTKRRRLRKGHQQRPAAEAPCPLAENGGALPHACRQDRRTWGEMGGVLEIFRAHPVGVAETQSLPESHGTPVARAHPLNPVPGRPIVVRNCVALDALGQVGSLASVSGYGFGRTSKCSVVSWANC